MNFIIEFFLFLFKGRNEEDKRRIKLLQQLTREFKRNRYRNFYNPHRKELTAECGEFFFDLYKAFKGMQSSFLHAEESELLKELTADHFFTETHRDAANKLMPKAILKLSEKMSPLELEDHVETDLRGVHALFNRGWRNKVDETYRMIISFVWLVNFDYYRLLRALDNAIPENAHSYQPIFHSVKLLAIKDHLHDFMAIYDNCAESQHWDDVFAILRKYAKKQIIDLDVWKSKLKKIDSVRESKIFIMMARHAEESPYWENKTLCPRDKIADKQIDKMTENAKNAIIDLMSKIKTDQIEGLLGTIFEKVEIPSPSYANTAESDDLASPQDRHGDFKHAKEFRWIFAFDMMFWQTLSEICDILIVYGEWTSRESSRDMSAMLQELTLSHDKLVDFDKSLSEQGIYGPRLKLQRSKAVQGRQQRENLHSFIAKINTEIEDIINTVVYCLKQADFHLCKYLAPDDQKNTTQGDITNWTFIKKTLKDKKYDLPEMHKKIDALFTLLEYSGLHDEEF
jgi:hypothetical protein